MDKEIRLKNLNDLLARLRENLRIANLEVESLKQVIKDVEDTIEICKKESDSDELSISTPR